MPYRQMEMNIPDKLSTTEAWIVSGVRWKKYLGLVCQLIKSMFVGVCKLIYRLPFFIKELFPVVAILFGGFGGLISILYVLTLATSVKSLERVITTGCWILLGGVFLFGIGIIITTTVRRQISSIQKDIKSKAGMEPDVEEICAEDEDEEERSLKLNGSEG